MTGCNHQHHASQNLSIALLLNLVFTALEIAGGFWTNSVAILTDAVHDSGDCFALGLAWYLQILSQRRPDALFTYGYRRMSLLGALCTGLLLTAAIAYVGWESIDRLRRPEPVYAPGVVFIAVAGVLFNGAAAWRLRGGRSLNESMARWHLLEDTLSWIAVLVGGAAMWLWNLPLVDPILSLLIGCFVMWNVFQNLRRVGLVFLQAAPAGFDAEAFDREIAAVPGVVSAHHTHTWTLDGDRHVFSTHLVLCAAATRDDVVAAKRRVHELLRQQHFEHITVEVELEGEQCESAAASKP